MQSGYYLEFPDQRQKLQLIHSQIIESTEYLHILKWDKLYLNRVSSPQPYNIQPDFLNRVLSEYVYLCYTASKHNYSITLDPNDVTYSQQGKTTAFTLGYNISQGVNSANLVSTIKQALSTVITKVIQPCENNSTLTKSKQLILESVQKCKSLEIVEFLKYLEGLSFFVTHSKLKRIQKGLGTISMIESKGIEMIQSIKQEKFEFQKPYHKIVMGLKSEELKKKLEKYGLVVHYVDKEALEGNKIRFFACLNMISVMGGEKDLKDAWDRNENKFLIEISPQEQIMTFRLLISRNDKIDYTDENIYKASIFSFMGNLVSIENYKLRPQEYQLTRVGTKTFFAFKTCSDIGYSHENIRKVFMICDFLITTWKVLETYFLKSVNETEPKIEEIRKELEHYQQMIMRSLLNIYS